MNDIFFKALKGCGVLRTALGVCIALATASQSPAFAFDASEVLTARDIANNPWLKSPSAAECSFGCLYTKATEAQSYEAVYLEARIRRLQEARTKNGGGWTDSQVASQIQGFCIPGEAAGACIDRYQESVVRRLRSLRYAMLVNNKSAYELKLSEKAGDQHKFSFQDPPGLSPALNTTAGKTQPQAPHVETLDEIKATFVDPNIHILGSADFERWAKEIPNAPSIEEFAEFIEVPRNPGTRGGEMMKIVKTDAQGNPVYDVKAYKKAMQVYLANKKRYAAESTALLREVKGLKKDDAKPRDWETTPYISDEDVEAFRDAHQVMVEGSNDLVKQKSIDMNGKGKNANRPAPAPPSSRSPAAPAVDDTLYGKGRGPNAKDPNHGTASNSTYDQRKLIDPGNTQPLPSTNGAQTGPEDAVYYDPGTLGSAIDDIDQAR